MSVTGSVQYHYHEDSPIGNRSLKVGRICWKGRYRAWSERVTDDESGDDERDGMTNGWGGESHETRLVRLMKWSSKMIPRTMWSASKWAICDLQAGNGWRARKSDNRWGVVLPLQGLPNPSLPSCDLDLWPPEPQSWSYHALPRGSLVPNGTKIGLFIFKYCVHELVTDGWTDGRTNGLVENSLARPRHKNKH